MTDDDEFLAAFESTSFPRAEWTHRAHVRMAWLYLSRSCPDDALERMRTGIQRYNAAHGAPDGYHETVTQAFARLIHHRRQVDPGVSTFEAFGARHADLFAKNALSRHYSDALLGGAAARAGFHAPDARALPLVGTVRAAGAADASSVAGVYAPYVEGTAISFELVAPNAEEMARRIDSPSGLPWRVFETSRLEDPAARVVGFACATPFRTRPAYRWTVEVTVYVEQGLSGRGVARALYGDLFHELERVGTKRLIACIALPNDRSVALHERVGFRPAGRLHAVGFKLDAWHDLGLWELSLGGEPADVGPKS